MNSGVKKRAVSLIPAPSKVYVVVIAVMSSEVCVSGSPPPLPMKR